MDELREELRYIALLLAALDDAETSLRAVAMHSVQPMMAQDARDVLRTISLIPIRADG